MHGDARRDDDSDAERPHLPRRAAHARPYGDDEFDADPRRRVQDQPTTIGMIGFITSMVSIGLLVVVIVFYYALNQEDQQLAHAQRRLVMYYWFLILDAVSFLAAVFATVFSARGLSPRNPLYRGWSVLGLILAIIGIVVTLIFGFLTTCAVLLFPVFNPAG